MVKRKSKGGEDKLLTEVELEVMMVLWRLGEGTVRDVMAALPADRSLAYTSVSTMLRILEQKGVVASRKEGRHHVYVPTVEQQAYQALSVRHVVETVFSGAPTALVRGLIDSKLVGREDLEEIKKLLDHRLEEDR